MDHADRDYRERYVAFMDVLGFSQLVSDADSEPYKREVILAIIKSLRNTISEIPPTNFRFTQFSDCIAVSADRTPEGLVSIFSGCAALVSELLQLGVMLRGGIAVGNLVHTSDVLFGTGLLKALKHDRTGGNPRIALQPEVVSDAKRWGYGDLTRTDHTDHFPMLHVLWEFENIGHETPMQPLVKTAARKIIRQMDANLSRDDYPADVKSKWLWMAKYWNSVTA
ncbi:hypothetical protein [Sphingomonas sp. 35-24ZXX]|uniref:hypothetical protein n=1 Tax=Sphingomonas sp. 35-24ZXX TaxID=1545915 RepID=UPI0012E03822|nr:hypothetical protein [Sphingomonas sp. 35-24ZXX]